MPNLTPESVYRRNLPHVQPAGATFFITFRLADSLPAEVVAALLEEAKQVQAELERLPDSPERSQRLQLEQRRYFGKWDALLDLGAGPDWLRRPGIAVLVAENMRFFAAKRYRLLAYCIMPNHVHVVLTPLQKEDGSYYPLARIMHTMKGYTAGRANKLLGRDGAFWLHESYDHYARDTAELQRILHYVVNNPVKAGLVADWKDWPWTYLDSDLHP